MPIATLIVAGGAVHALLKIGAAMPTADFAKWPKREEIAKVVLFLASDEAHVIHRAAIPVLGNN